MVEIMLIPGGTVKDIKIEENTTVLKILDLLNLPPDIVVVMKNNSPIPVDSIIDDKDKLKIVRVVSGG
ncbi:MAG: MoaD/ThiS family protein [Thermoplasmata archaeon]